MAKEKKVKPIVYNANDREITAVLKEFGPMTLAEIGEKLGRTINPGVITSVRSKGLIADVGEKDIERDGFKPAMTYSFATNEPAVRANGKAYAYSETELAILNALKDFDTPVTLAAISEKMGATLTSGNINALVKKGNVVKGESIKVATKIPAVVKVYGYVMDVPADSESAE